MLDLITAPYYSFAFSLENEQGYWHTSRELFDLRRSSENCSTLPEIELLLSVRSCNSLVTPRHQITYSSIKIKASRVDGQIGL